MSVVQGYRNVAIGMIMLSLHFAFFLAVPFEMLPEVEAYANW